MKIEKICQAFYIFSNTLKVGENNTAVPMFSTWLKKFFYLSSFTEIWFWPGSEITWTFGSGSGINLFRYDTLGFMIKSLRRKHEFSFHNGRKCRKVWLPALRHLSGGVLRTIVHHNHFIAPFSSLYTVQTKIIYISAET